jgi:acyl-CoA oxidase
MKLLENHPVFGRNDKCDLNIIEDRELTLNKTLAFAELRNSIVAKDEKEFKRKYYDLYSLASLSDQSFTTRYAVSYGLFRDNLLSQATDDIVQEYLPRIESGEIYGCFGMTELGHGSNVKNLETEARFDRSNEQFIINSPTLTSTKWWIGAAGKTATHGVIFAQLIIDDKNYGVHSFLVPLRSMENHEPLPGITIGDIGHKQGKQGVDNGYIQFKDVRIPRRNMLQKWATVTPDGAYKKTSNVSDQIAYGVLIGGRLNIVLQAPYDMIRALTIAIRYACIRRQFHTTDKHNETKLLDYQQHQYRLLPLVAQAYALTFAARQLKQMKIEVDKAFEEGRVYEELANAHSDAAGLKAYSTWMAHYTLDQCRQAMGGHGYSKYNGISDLYNDYTINTTWEGDNTVLAQQTARHLLKSAQSVMKGKKVTGSISYLNRIVQIVSKNCAVVSESDFLNPKVQMKAYQYRVCKLIANVSARMQTEKFSNEQEAWNNCQTDLIKCAKAHCYLYLLDAFIHAVQSVTDVNVKQALKNVCDLFALYHLEEDSSILFTEGYMSAKQSKLLSSQLRKLLIKVRLDAVPLVDAYNFSDFIINSPLGRYDGNIYQAYFDRVKRNPLNLQ